MTSETALELFELWRKLCETSKEMPTYLAAIDLAIAALRREAAVGELVEALRKVLNHPAVKDAFEGEMPECTCSYCKASAALAKFDGQREGGKDD